MLNSLFNPAVNNLERALDRTSQRATLLAGNLANVNTPGYQRKDVDFGIELDEASEQLQSATAPVNPTPVGDLNNARVDGNNVDLEREVDGLAEASVRYQALSQMVASYFSGMKEVIKG